VTHLEVSIEDVRTAAEVLRELVRPVVA